MNYRRAESPLFLGIDNAIYTEDRRDVTVAGVNSLLAGLDAFFSTYECLRGLWLDYWSPKFEGWDFENNYPVLADGSEISLRPGFVRLSQQTILGFQHFFELVVKDILRTYCAATGSDETRGSRGRKEPNFSQSLKHLKNAHNPRTGSLDRVPFLVTEEAMGCLHSLGEFRNQIWHNGTVFLDPFALDRLLVTKLLPMVAQTIEALDLTARIAIVTKRIAGGAKVCPFQELVNLADGFSFKDRQSVALLKATGKALLQDKGISRLRPPSRGARITSEQIALMQDRDRNRHKSFHGPTQPVRECLACGMRTLVSLMADEFYSDEPDERGELRSRYVFEVQCFNCGFRLEDRDFEEAGEMHGIDMGDIFKQLV